MAKTKKQTTSRLQAYKPLLAAALAVAGIFNMVGVAIAEGTPAGTTISNTATATYDDGDATTPLVNTVSNTVEVRVAKIAGLTAVASPVEDLNQGAIEFDDELVYTFTVTNVGNAETDVFVPGVNDLAFENFVPRSVADSTGDSFAIEVLDKDGNLIGTLDTTDSGTTLTDLINNGSNYTIDPDESFIVKVYGKPDENAVADDPVSVQLGDVSDNTDTPGPDPTQNRQHTGNDLPPVTNDLRTVDLSGDAPDNGEREAQAIGSAPYASSVKPLALATIEKTSSLDVKVSSVADDDVITYSLDLNVADTSPSPDFQAAALTGTDIRLDTGSGATTVNRILVSDAIPTDTEFVSVGATPAGWTPVYTTSVGDPLDTTATTWTTLQPTAASVERVGFIFDGSIGAGGSVTGLTFDVVTNGLDPSTGGIIENIAQVFGSTVGGDPTLVVYDESGDENPNNFDGATPPAVEGSSYDPLVDTGIPGDLVDANGDNQPDDTTNVDTAGDNTGAGPDGELNVVSVTPTADDILNGTDGVPGAIGPTGDNDDFTNLSTTVPAGLAPADTFDPDVATFNNTLSNPAGPTAQIADVTIEPLSPSEATFASDPINPANQVSYSFDADGDGTLDGDGAIPDGTLVTIEANGQLAIYEYDLNGTTGTFNLITNTEPAPGSAPVLDPAAQPVNVGDVNGGDSVDYTVKVDLPDGTEQLRGTPIPIVAFADDDPAPTGTPGYQNETTNNITIDRVYTGFMELTKQASIIAADGVTVLEGPTDAITREIEPGEFIEYLLEYRNISESIGGNGSIFLTATDFRLVEDGNAVAIPAAGSAVTATDVVNNWATTTTHEQETVAETGSTVNYFTASSDTTATAGTSDPISGTQVEKYENVVPSVAAGDEGTFTFRRMANLGDTPTTP